MKTLFVLLSLLIFQTNNPFYNFLDQNYEGGSKVFLDEMAKSIRYPTQARNNCRIGKLKTKLTLSTDGTIEDIQFLNELGSGIEKEVEQALNTTKGSWLASDSKREVEFVVAFQIGISPTIPGDINISAIGFERNQQGSSMVSCGSNEELLKDLTEQLKKKKYKKANKLCNELLRRDPDSDHYNNLKVTIDNNLK